MMASMAISTDKSSTSDKGFILVREDFENMKMVLRCGICCSTLKDPVVTTCLHAFCRTCFNLCMDKLSTLRCPICNQRLNKRSCGTCPRLLELISGYIRLAKLYKCDSAAIDIPKEADFLESQVLMTQNVVENIDPLPLQQTTNIVTNFKQPFRRHALKRTLGMENSVSSCRPGKVTRNDANVVEGRESGVHTRAAAPLHSIKEQIGATLSMKLSTPPEDAVVSSYEDRSLTASDGNGECQCLDDYHTKIKKHLKSYDTVQLNGNPQMLDCNADGSSPFKEDNLAEWPKNPFVETSSEVVESVNTRRVPRRLARRFQKDIENMKKLSTTEVNAECLNMLSYRCEASAQACVDTVDAAAQCAPKSHTTSVETYVSGNGRCNNRTQTNVVPSKCQDLCIQMVIASHDVMTQTEFEQNLVQASMQTILECQEIGLQTEQSVKCFVDSVVQTEVTDDFHKTGIRMDSCKYPERKTIEEMENGDAFVERRRLSVDHARSDAADAARKLELIVNRRFEKQAAETRIQALLACLPWIPTFLGLDYDGFSQRFSDDATPLDRGMVVEHLDEERCSVVEASEDEANEAETNDETALSRNVHSECFNNTLKKEIDLNDSRGLEGIVEQSWPKQNEEPAQLKYEEKSTLQDAYKEKQAWGSQSVNILKMNIVLASKEVVADSLGSCSQHQLKLMISGLTSHSEVEYVEKFVKIFPTTRLIREMTRDCTHLVIFNTDGRLCKNRSLKYAYAIANRSVVVTHEWLRDCIKHNGILPVEEYEVEGDVLVNQMSRAARRSRDGDGNLFDGFTFYLPPPYFRSSKLVTKDLLTEIIQMVGGKCVEHLWDLPSNKCAYVIFAPGSRSADAARRFEKDIGVEVLVADWVLDSICEYRVLQHNTHVYRVANRTA